MVNFLALIGSKAKHLKKAKGKMEIFSKKDFAKLLTANTKTKKMVAAEVITVNQNILANNTIPIAVNANKNKAKNTGLANKTSISSSVIENKKPKDFKKIKPEETNEKISKKTESVLSKKQNFIAIEEDEKNINEFKPNKPDSKVQNLSKNSFSFDSELAKNNVNTIEKPSPMPSVENIANKIMVDLNNYKSGEDETSKWVEFSLNAIEFGKLNVSIEAENKDLRVVLATENIENIQKLEEYFADLRQTLQKSGFNNVDLDFRFNSNNENQSNFSSKKHNKQADKVSFAVNSNNQSEVGIIDNQKRDFGYNTVEVIA